MNRDRRTFIGLDLGQAHTYSALVVLTREPEVQGAAANAPSYTLPYLHRFPLGTAYLTIVTFTRALLQTPELTNATLLLDRTIVGRAVSDLFAVAHADITMNPVVPVTITAGDAVAVEEGGYRLPKRELVSVLQVLLQAGRMRIAPSLAHADLLVQELRTFQVKPTLASSDAFEAWREGPHDDLVLATALAAWYGERQRPCETIDDAPRVGLVAAWASGLGLSGRRRFHH